MHNFGDNTKNHSQTLDFTTNFFLWIMWISTCVWWITLWITRFVSTYKQSYPHYPQFYMPYPLLSYPHSIHSFFPLIHMLSTAYPQYYPHFTPMLLIFFTDCSPLLSWNIKFSFRVSFMASQFSFNLSIICYSWRRYMVIFEKRAY